MPVIKPKIIGRISDVKGVEEITTLFRDEIKERRSCLCSNDYW